jgi:hypothetical protein
VRSPRLCSRCLLPGHDKRRCRAVLPGVVKTQRVVTLNDNAGAIVLTFEGDPLKMASDEAEWLAGLLRLVDEYESRRRTNGGG